MASARQPVLSQCFPVASGTWSHRCTCEVVGHVSSPAGGVRGVCVSEVPVTWLQESDFSISSSAHKGLWRTLNEWRAGLSAEFEISAIL